MRVLKRSLCLVTIVTVVFGFSMSVVAKTEPLTIEGIESALELTASEKTRALVQPLLDTYNKAKGNKAAAIAQSSGAGIALGIATKAQSEAHAAMIATQQCQLEKEEAKVDAPCEVVLLGNAIVRRGQQFHSEVVLSDPANVWRIQGEHANVYLVGTLHILKPTLFPLPDVYDRAFELADQVAFETNPLLMTDPQRIAALQRRMIPDPKFTKKDLGKPLVKLLKKYARQQGLRYRDIYSAKPILSFIQIPQLKALALGYDASSGMEMHYARLASTAGKPILEIEAPDAAIAPLFDAPLSTQIQLLQNAMNNLDFLNIQWEQMISAWFSGQADVLYDMASKEFSISPGAALLRDVLIDQRNRQMAERVQKYLGLTKTTTVMVGAGHMGGPNGLLALLRDAGFNPVQLNQLGEQAYNENLLPVSG